MLPSNDKKTREGSWNTIKRTYDYEVMVATVINEFKTLSGLVSLKVRLSNNLFPANFDDVIEDAGDRCNHDMVKGFKKP